MASILDSVFPDPEDLLNSRSLRFVSALGTETWECCPQFDFTGGARGEKERVIKGVGRFS